MATATRTSARSESAPNQHRISTGGRVPPKPWEQQPEETEAGYRAFAVYRDLPPQERSIDAACAKLREKRFQANPRYMRTWSVRFRWVSRVEAWEAEQDRVFRKEMVAERRRMARQHARIAGAMLSKALEKLRDLPVSEIDTRDMVALLDKGTSIERAALGEPHAARLEVTGADGGPIEIEGGDDELALLAELNLIAGVLRERVGRDDD